MVLFLDDTGWVRHIGGSSLNLYMYPDASGVWSSNTMLVMPLPPGIDHTRTCELHDCTTTSTTSMLTSCTTRITCLMLDKGLV
jgi:hypothetical protein